MNVFETHEKIVNDYASYVRSFINISDPAISKKVDDELAQGKLWPQPLLQFNPAYEISGNITDIVKDGLFHNTINDIFKGYSLYHHQRKAIELGISGKDFIVTSGTGSGKSLTYIGTIFNHLLTNPQSEGVTAIIVYPMNALINSQTNEFNIFKNNFEKTTGKEFPIIFGQYTGQEDESSRIGMREKPPHILLTNYMMLELLLTRIQERPIRDAIYKNLKFLVFDELHTYRGRQGADVAMLIRRISALCNQEVSFIGTSATMVSGTDSESQKEQVAQVATTLFGRTFSSEQIVDEKLTRSLINLSHAKEDLANAIAAGINIHGTDKELKAHPIAIWLENKIAIEEIDSQLIRRKPQKISDVISALSEDSGLSEEICRNCLEKVLLWISTVNQETMKKGSRYTILPYKLHQFIAQTGSVYTTLDQEEDSRYITLEPGIYKQDDEKKKPIFPNVFSRATGHPFICVSLANNRLEPREFRENSDEELQGTDGYLIIGDNVWDPEDDLDNLPEAWTRMTKNGLVINKNKNDFFPIKLFFDEYGNCSEIEELKYSGWFMKAPLLFDPTGGVFFDTKTNDGTKLTKLGREGRSTSTTITAFSILNQLNEAKYPIKDQKLLSFTDNRQDAALQAGHFNDFIKVIQFRAGIYKALKSSPDNTLSYKNIGEEVFKALNLPFCDFANRNEEPQLAAIRKGYEEVFKKFIFYRAITDLRRSWRIILPNLEQCALLRIDYKDLPEIVTEDEFWSDMPIVSNLNHNDRHEFIANVLDFFRLEYALHSENFLIPSILNENGKEFKEKLKAPWTLDRDEYLKEPNVIRYEPLKKSVKLTSKSMGSASGLGKYIKHYAKQKDLDTSLLKGELYHDFILKLMVKLTDADYLTFSTAPSEKSGEVPVYRLKIDKILWKLGDGETIKVDVIKNRFYKKNQLKPNEYFRDVYSRDFSIIKKLRAEDHTGQLNTDDRKQREERFRAEWYINNNKDFPDEEKIRSQSISALFCSPTMELGIDIGGLSVVHLRNAPPNPANYAQRSGRAGRNGQGALIFTYCSSFSPHDRHFFNNQAELVAGTVQASQIDLKNKELLLTHLNALVISYVGLPGLDSHGGNRPSLMQLVEDDNNKMPLSPAVHEGLQISPTMLSTIKATFKTVIKDFESKLPTDSWYSIDWIDKNIGEIADHLDNSLKRWRSLYSSARILLTRATQPIESGRLTVGSEEYKKNNRLQSQANRQLNLLRNDIKGSGELSEFYPYRYLASEGFLPGYNFTRLPIRIFIPTENTSGEYISRPRSIALREFGPLNVIYHNGRKYQVSQLVVQDTESSLTDAKISTKAGYFLTDEQKQLELCPFSGYNLSDNANTEYLHDLLEMSESRGEEKDRISCEEEERVSRGFDVKTYFRVDGGDFDRIKKTIAKSTETDLLNLRYIPAARLIHVNTKWRSVKTEGFPIGLTSGDWRQAMPHAEDSVNEEYRLVKLWTSNLADALYIEPIQPLGLDADGVITLQHALKRAIETVFQVEPNEIGVVSIGNPASPNILLYEASEGSLGILSQFFDNVGIYHKVIAAAKEICRFDETEYKAPASYDDLLSYYNQRDHKIIDRFLIKDALDKLAICTVEQQTNSFFNSYEDHYQSMMKNLDPNSSTEMKFINYLHDNGLRLPDAAQKQVEGVYCQPDFYYEPRIWVFCDGTPHDDINVKTKDSQQRQAILAKGHEVWSWHYSENLAEKIAKRPDIFKKVK